MNEDTLKKINSLHERILKTKGIISACKELKQLHDIEWIMKSDYQTYHYGKPYIDIILDQNEMRMMDDFLDKLIFKKEKELSVLNEQFSKY